MKILTPSSSTVQAQVCRFEKTLDFSDELTPVDRARMTTLLTFHYISAQLDEAMGRCYAQEHPDLVGQLVLATTIAQSQKL